MKHHLNAFKKYGFILSSILSSIQNYSQDLYASSGLGKARLSLFERC